MWTQATPARQPGGAEPVGSRPPRDLRGGRPRGGDGREGRPVPGNAPAAKQMGRYVGRLLAARVAGGPAPPPFAYRHHGDLATIGRRSAVVELGKIRLTGLVGWWFWGVAHVWYLVGFRSRV